MTTHEEHLATVSDRASHSVMQAAGRLTGPEHVHAAAVRRLEPPSEDADVEVMFAAATTGGILTSTTSSRAARWGRSRARWSVGRGSAGIARHPARPR